MKKCKIKQYLFFYLFYTLCTSSLLFCDDFTRQMEPSHLQLKKEYIVFDSTIYSTHIFPTISKRFKIATIPPDRFSIELQSVDLKLLFARYGYELSFDSDVVLFRYVNDMREKDALDFLKKMYIQYYGNRLEIDNILVRPLYTRPIHYEQVDFEIPPSSLKKNTGSFIMKYHIPGKEQQKKLTFIYEIQGSLSVFASTRAINVNENLDEQNTREMKIKFERVNAPFINKDDINSSGAKSYIRADMLITKDKIKPRVLVKKGERIRASNNFSGINAEVVLIARQSGAKNDIINAQNPESGKILRVKILDIGRGEIL